ncbi:hypothetical protein [Streptomyces sp. NPDC046925]|uniref:hypothetical protein n=1 Tax=Streptomyces sp. NPDC046925 TaxID=3155375 RepID=UPI0033E1A52D
MALAHLRQQGDDGRGHLLFQADLGANRYFTYIIGGPNWADRDGFPELSEVSHTGPLAGPLPEHSLGRTQLRVPADLFTRDHDLLQLVSYRQPPDIGPALAEPVRVRPAAGAHPRPPGGGEQRMTYGHQQQAAAAAERAVQPFSYRESGYSEEMFLEALAPVLNLAMPLLGKLLPMLGGGGAPTGASAAPAVPGAAGAAGSDVVQQLLELLLKKLQSTPAAPTGSPAAPTPGIGPVQQASLALSAGDGHGYSRAMNPMLLAAMPVIEKALNPETLKAIGGLSASSQAQAAQEQVRQHLERILPSSDTTAIYQLLALLSQQASTGSLSAVMPLYSPAPGTQLAVDPRAERPAVTLRGRVRRLYRNDRACTFPLVLSAPRPIDGARLRWQVRRATSADPLIDEVRPVERIPGPEPSALSAELSAADMARLAPGEEHVLCAYVLWETRSGRSLGAETLVSFTPVGPYAYDSVQEGTDDATILLDDVELHRDFWHKVWQATLDEDVFRYHYECKYYVGLDTQAQRTERGITRIKDDPLELHTRTGRLEAALQLALGDLNAVLQSAGGRPGLDPAHLSALHTTDFTRRFSAAGRSKVRFGGRRGTSVALWVFPELRLRTVLLQRCQESDGHGRVTATVPEPVLFPFPQAVHFVGVTSQQNGG